MAGRGMIAVDTNILVHAHRRSSPHWHHVFGLLQEFAHGSEFWAIPWPCCYEFLGVTTNRRIWGDTVSTTEQAWRQLEAWTASPSCRQIGETAGFMDTLSEIVNRPNVRGPMMHDAQIAAICVAHGVEALLTCDRDFSRFPELVTRNPLVAR